MNFARAARGNLQMEYLPKYPTPALTQKIYRIIDKHLAAIKREVAELLASEAGR